MLKIGDRVEVIKSDNGLYTDSEMIGWKGTIICNDVVDFGIEFDNSFEFPFKGHSCGGRAKPKHGRYIPEYLLRKISCEQLEFNF
jgi:hypothetical protein